MGFTMSLYSALLVFLLISCTSGMNFIPEVNALCDIYRENAPASWATLLVTPCDPTWAVPCNNTLPGVVCDSNGHVVSL